jgi:hypothetical protein
MKLPPTAANWKMAKSLSGAKKQLPLLDVLWRAAEFLCLPGFM